MLRLHATSDLHVEFPGASIPDPPPDIDLLVLAGDYAPVRPGGMRELRRAWASAPEIVYVPGNHEFYGHEMGEARAELARQCADAGIRLLDPGVLDMGGFRVIGATLWTDFRLGGRYPLSADLAARRMSDYHVIADDRSGLPGKRLTPWITEREHGEQRAWIEGALGGAAAAGREAIVVTHHAPSAGSVARWRGDRALDPCYASNLEPVIRAHRPRLWIHGHTHASYDYRVEDTRILCNPRGYCARDGTPENAEWDPGLVVEVAPGA